MSGSSIDSTIRFLENIICTEHGDQSSSDGDHLPRHDTSQMRDISNRGSLNLNSNHGRETGNNFFEALLPHNLHKPGSSNTHSENNNSRDHSARATSRFDPRNFTSSSHPRASENSGTTNSANNSPDRSARARNVAPEQIDRRFDNNNNNTNHPEISVPFGRALRSFPLLPHQMMPFSGFDIPVASTFASSSSNETDTATPARHRSDMTGGGTNVRDFPTAPVAHRNRMPTQLLPMHIVPYFEVEDYMSTRDSGGFVESSDRQRDLRLDVDNMSYEDLMELGERIGNVSNGLRLSDEKIIKSMNQSKYEAVRDSADTERCCICQEDYVGGEDIGKLNCGHEFHVGCIIQWLKVKNACPMCKTTAI